MFFTQEICNLEKMAVKANFVLGIHEATGIKRLNELFKVVSDHCFRYFIKLQ